MKIEVKIPGLDKLTNREDIVCPSCGTAYKFIEHSSKKIFHYVTEGEPQDQISLRIVIGREEGNAPHMDCACNKCHCEFKILECADGEA